VAHADIDALDAQLVAASRDAASLVEGLGEDLGTWRAAPGVWGVADCLDHLGTANTVYLRAMVEPARRARQQGRLRQRPALPGLFGGWFARLLEPPAKSMSKSKAPHLIQPHPSPTLADGYTAFTTSQDGVRAFLRDHADLDLARIRFPNPLVRGVAFSLASGLHIIAAHDRRHLWQAWRARAAAELAQGVKA
jgi:hypothetical protein